MTQLRTLRSLALAGAALFAAVPVIAQDDTRPTVAVLYFENSTFGKANADYQPLSKGIADLLITSMASNSKFRVVERDELQAIMQEQNLAKDKSVVDQATAIRLGKLLNAHHLITGGFISDPKGNLTLTARAIEVETSKIEMTEKVTGKQEDIMSLIDILAEKLNSNLKLKAIQLRVGDAAPIEGTIKGSTTLETKPASLESKIEVGAEKSEKKLDFKSAMLYSKALNHLDSGNKKEAEASFKAVLAKFPEFAPAKKQLSRLQTASGE